MDQFKNDLSSASPRDAEAPLRALLKGFPMAERDDMRGLIGTYLIAIEGYSLAAIERSVKRFIRGEVDGHDPRFAPTPAQFSRDVKSRQDVITPPAPRLALPAPGDAVRTEEEIERRRALAERIKGKWGSKPMPVEPGEDFDAWDQRVRGALATKPPRLSAEALEPFGVKPADEEAA